jgi:hypothetical protein
MHTPKPYSRETKPLLNPGTLKLVEEALAIEAEEAKAAGALGFMARISCLVCAGRDWITTEK